MIAYFDTAYVSKCYLNEPDARRVRALADEADVLATSTLAIAEFACVLLRHRREGRLTAADSDRVRETFRGDLDANLWVVLPVTIALLRTVERRVGEMRENVFLRAADAIHLATAAEAGFTEIWSSDRHLLAAAPQFGLTGRSV